MKIKFFYLQACLPSGMFTAKIASNVHYSTLQASGSADNSAQIQSLVTLKNQVPSPLSFYYPLKTWFPYRITWMATSARAEKFAQQELKASPMFLECGDQELNLQMLKVWL